MSPAISPVAPSPTLPLVLTPSIGVLRWIRGKVPIALKEAKEVRSSSMQTPHDPEVTYSGHKGKGYEVQVSETCEEENAVQVITHVEVTPSSGGDPGVTVGVIDTLRERGIGPPELWCDTSYGSGHNGWEAERRGTELVSPVGGRGRPMRMMGWSG